MSDLVIRRVRRSIDEAKNRGGMQTGMPKVTIDAGDAERLCILSDGLIKATSEAGWHERQKWDVQAENEALRARVANLVEALEEARQHVVVSPGPVRGGFIQEIDAALAVYRKQEDEI